MESRIAFGIANSCDGPTGFWVGDISEHALRRVSDVAWLSRARRRDFFRRFSTLAATGGHGVLPSALLPSSTDCGTAPFWATQHDQRGVLRHSGWARRRL